MPLDSPVETVHQSDQEPTFTQQMASERSVTGHGDYEPSLTWWTASERSVTDQSDHKPALTQR